MAKIQAVSVFFVMLATFTFVTYTTQNEPPEEQPSPGTLESDMKLTDEQLGAIVAIVEAEANGVVDRKAKADLTYRWPNAEVPYAISDSSRNDGGIIRKALAYWESNTCIRFPLYNSVNANQHRIEFIKADGCWSWVGDTGKLPQNISIGAGCEWRGTIAHEIGHAIGFWHEQSRDDRDNYVTVHLGNVKSGQDHNFNKYTANNVNSYNVPYDVGSLMHYGPKYFSKNGLDTITANNPEDQDKMGQDEHLSTADILLANIIYDCPGRYISGYL
uniref:Metalloendopeptidase n=1 Tax=Saccoglossus kowalevskii TaxID=10224 RepID=A0ABM0M851_SACKO|nr:PREDICTED: blastula protease 10-like [Saccoglossus kowalevskii]